MRRSTALADGRKASSKTTRPTCSPTGLPATDSANQFRLFLHSAAYVASNIGIGTQWTTSNFDTRVLKVGARVREQATKVRTSYPLGSDADRRPQPDTS